MTEQEIDMLLERWERYNHAAIEDAIEDDSRVAAGLEPLGTDDEPDDAVQCCECEELAVGYDEGSPYCAAHYQSRGPFIAASILLPDDPE